MHKGEHHLLLIWLMLISVISFALFIAWHENVMLLLYLGDSSKLSWAITLLFIIITIYCARRICFLSSELNLSKTVEALVRNSQAPRITVEDGEVFIAQNTPLPGCLLTTYLRDLSYQLKPAPVDQKGEMIINGSELMEVYEGKLKNPHNIGWFFTDMMIKLGLLGTIIGFVLMLGSVVNVNDFDVSTMQSILQQMSAGMGTALYTTFAGLVCSILTASQCYLLDQAADELLDISKHLIQVHILPRL